MVKRNQNSRYFWGVKQGLTGRGMKEFSGMMVMFALDGGWFIQVYNFVKIQLTHL